MKLIYVFLFMPLILQAESFRTKYNQFMKNPGYVGMSAIEIAVDIEDFPAIRHFAYKATKEDLIKAHELLLNKIDIHKINIKDSKAKYLTQPEKGNRIEKIDKERNQLRFLKNELRDLNRRINMKTPSVQQ